MPLVATVLGFDLFIEILAGRCAEMLGLGAALLLCETAGAVVAALSVGTLLGIAAAVVGATAAVVGVAGAGVLL